MKRNCGELLDASVCFDKLVLVVNLQDCLERGDLEGSLESSLCNRCDGLECCEGIVYTKVAT